MQDLLTVAHLLPTLSPRELAETASKSTHSPFQVPQSADDSGNISAITKAIKSNTQPCIMTKENQVICQNIYPERRKQQGAHNILEVDGRDIKPTHVDAFVLEYNDERALHTDIWRDE